MKAPDEQQIESLLRGTIREPSFRFEAALQTIPERIDAEGKASWLAGLKPLALAASLILAVSILVFRDANHHLQPVRMVSSPQLDPQWMELFSMADALNAADTLSDDEILPALEFYAFNR